MPASHQNQWLRVDTQHETSWVHITRIRTILNKKRIYHCSWIISVTILIFTLTKSTTMTELKGNKTFKPLDKNQRCIERIEPAFKSAPNIWDLTSFKKYCFITCFIINFPGRLLWFFPLNIFLYGPPDWLHYKEELNRIFKINHCFIRKEAKITS